ncbi:MAG: hypothetical protein R2788_16170 [Saprospiraceae bacterium]
MDSRVFGCHTAKRIARRTWANECLWVDGQFFHPRFITEDIFAPAHLTGGSMANTCGFAIFMFNQMTPKRFNETALVTARACDPIRKECPMCGGIFR